MITATRSMQRRSSASWAGSPKWGLKRGYVAQLTGICRIRSGWIRQAAVHLATGSRRIMPGGPRASPNEGHYSGGWQGHAPVPFDNFDQQADVTGVRQANDLLPAFHVDVGRYSRNIDHQHAGCPAWFS